MVTADPVRPQETLRDRIAEVIHLRICGCGGTLTDRHLSGPYIRAVADAVLPIVEEETARLRRDIDIAESVAGARQINYREQHDRVLEWALRDQRRAGDAEDSLAALRDKVKTLAAKWRAKPNGFDPNKKLTEDGIGYWRGRSTTFLQCADEVDRLLRALVEEPQGGEQ